MLVLNRTVSLRVALVLAWVALWSGVEIISIIALFKTDNSLFVMLILAAPIASGVVIIPELMRSIHREEPHA